jgi:hypothetical protein
MYGPLIMQGVSKNLYNCVPNVTVWRVLRKLLHLKFNTVSFAKPL